MSLFRARVANQWRVIFGSAATLLKPKASSISRNYLHVAIWITSSTMEAVYRDAEIPWC